MARNLATTSTGQLERMNGESNRPALVYRPVTDIFETEDNVVVIADMPGVGAEDIDVTLERRVLTIRGRTSTLAPEGYREVLSEYGVGDYERVFTLSDDIEQDDIRAAIKDGVLRLELPKAASAKPKRIEVKAA